MSQKETQDESSNFVCESEDIIIDEVESQEVVSTEELAGSEESNTEDETSLESEAKDEDESLDKETDSGIDATADEPSKKSRSSQKRIDKLVRQREDAKREAEALKREVESLRNKKPEPELKEEVKEPVEKDYDTYDKYLDALDAFDKTKDVKSEAVEEPKQKDVEPEVNDGLTDSQKTALAIIQDRIESSTDKPDNFDEIALNPELHITGEMLEALSECDDLAKVMMHLGQNKELAAEIAKKTPALQMRDIARLDLTVASKPKKPTQLTNAPDVIDPVQGSDAQKKSHKEMSFAEFEADDRERNSKRKSTW